MKGVVLMSNLCSIPNDIKTPAKLQPSLKNKAINYLSPYNCVAAREELFTFMGISRVTAPPNFC